MDVILAIKKIRNIDIFLPTLPLIALVCYTSALNLLFFSLSPVVELCECVWVCECVRVCVCVGELSGACSPWFVALGCCCWVQQLQQRERFPPAWVLFCPRHWKARKVNWWLTASCSWISPSDSGREAEALSITAGGRYLGYAGPQSTSQQFLKMFLWLYGFWTLFFPDQEPLIWAKQQKNEFSLMNG